MEAGGGGLLRLLRVVVVKAAAIRGKGFFTWGVLRAAARVFFDFEDKRGVR